MNERPDPPAWKRLRALGALAIIAVLVTLAPAAAQRLINPQAQQDDPIYDTFGVSPIHDATAYSATADEKSLTMSMRFTRPIADITGYLDLDTDLSQGTGRTSHTTGQPECGPSGIGVDYYVDLGTYCAVCGYVSFKDAQGMDIAGVPMAVGRDVFTVTVPLSLLGGDSLVNTVATVGNYAGTTDCVPNEGHLSTGYAVYLPVVIR
jgi:hypothetical protein